MTSKTFITLLFFIFYINVHAQLSEVILDEQNNPNEPTVCFSHAEKNIIYAASNINNFYSLNTDKQTIKSQKTISPLGVYGDPVLSWANNSLYYTHLSKTPKKKYGDWFDRIVVQRVNNAESWDETSYSVGYNSGKMQDKPWLSSDNWSKKYGNNIYVTWTEFDKYGSESTDDHSRIRFSTMRNNSDSFSTAITISDTVGDCKDGDNTLEGATTAVDSIGNIYAVWAGHNNIYFDKSVDGGLSWSEDKVIAQQINGWDMEMPHIMRANGMPFIVSDVARDILYVCWADERNGNADIWLLVSKDKGNTWSKPRQLNLDKTNTHQYFPNIALDPNTGKVYVAYYDFKSSSTNTFYTISLASYDTAESIQNVQLTPYVTALPGKKIFYGDYLDLDIYDDQLAVVYTVYDLSQKSEIQLTTEATLADGIFSKIAISNTPAIVRNSDTAIVILNVEHPHKTKLKIKTENEGKKQRYTFKAIYTGKNTAWDQHVGAFLLDDETELISIKYRIRDLDIRNVYKRHINLFD